jgi:hypothetical protein
MTVTNNDRTLPPDGNDLSDTWQQTLLAVEPTAATTFAQLLTSSKAQRHGLKRMIITIRACLIINKNNIKKYVSLTQRH